MDLCTFSVAALDEQRDHIQFGRTEYKTLPEAQRTQGIASELELSLQLMVAPLALVPNLATRWRHMHELKNWPQDGATFISCMS